MKRKPTVAGFFYPSDPDVLKKMVNELLEKCEKFELKGKLKALVVPHAGYVYSGIVAAAGFRLLKNEKKVVLIGPSHQAFVEGVVTSSYEFWETPLGDVKTYESDLFPVFDPAHDHEHSIEVQLPFLQTVLKDFEILPIATGSILFKELAESVEKLLNDDTIIIVSSDLSHYYPYKKALEVDSLANESIPNLDTEKAEKIEACGKTGILAVMELAKKLKWKAEIVDYKTSGDTAGDKSKVVGYGCYVFYE